MSTAPSPFFEAIKREEDEGRRRSNERKGEEDGEGIEIGRRCAKARCKCDAVRRLAAKTSQTMVALMEADVPALNDFSVNTFLESGVAILVIVSLLIARAPLLWVLFACAFSRASVGVMSAIASLMRMSGFIKALLLDPLSAAGLSASVNREELVGGLRSLSNAFACGCAWAAVLQVVFCLAVSKERSVISAVQIMSLQSLLFPFVIALSFDVAVVALAWLLLGVRTAGAVVREAREGGGYRATFKRVWSIAAIGNGSTLFASVILPRISTTLVNILFVFVYLLLGLNSEHNESASMQPSMPLTPPFISTVFPSGAVVAAEALKAVVFLPSAAFLCFSLVGLLGFAGATSRHSRLKAALRRTESFLRGLADVSGPINMPAQATYRLQLRLLLAVLQRAFIQSLFCVCLFLTFATGGVGAYLHGLLTQAFLPISTSSLSTQEGCSQASAWAAATLSSGQGLLVSRYGAVAFASAYLDGNFDVEQQLFVTGPAATSVASLPNLPFGTVLPSCKIPALPDGHSQIPASALASSYSAAGTSITTFLSPLLEGYSAPAVVGPGAGLAAFLLCYYLGLTVGLLVVARRLQDVWDCEEEMATLPALDRLLPAISSGSSGNSSTNGAQETDPSLEGLSEEDKETALYERQVKQLLLMTIAVPATLERVNEGLYRRTADDKRGRSLGVQVVTNPLHEVLDVQRAVVRRAELWLPLLPSFVSPRAGKRKPKGRERGASATAGKAQEKTGLPNPLRGDSGPEGETGEAANKAASEESARAAKSLLSSLFSRLPGQARVSVASSGGSSVSTNRTDTSAASATTVSSAQDAGSGRSLLRQEMVAVRAARPYRSSSASLRSMMMTRGGASPGGQAAAQQPQDHPPSPPPAASNSGRPGGRRPGRKRRNSTGSAQSASREPNANSNNNTNANSNNNTNANSNNNTNANSNNNTNTNTNAAAIDSDGDVIPITSPRLAQMRVLVRAAKKAGGHGAIVTVASPLHGIAITTAGGTGASMRVQHERHTAVVLTNPMHSRASALSSSSRADDGSVGVATGVHTSPPAVAFSSLGGRDRHHLHLQGSEAGIPRLRISRSGSNHNGTSRASRQQEDEPGGGMHHTRVGVAARRNSSDETPRPPHEDDGEKDGEEEARDDRGGEEGEGEGDEGAITERSAMMGPLSARSGCSSARDAVSVSDTSSPAARSRQHPHLTLSTVSPRAGSAAGWLFSAVVPSELFSPHSVLSARRAAAFAEAGTGLGSIAVASPGALPAADSLASASVSASSLTLSPTHGTKSSWVHAAARAEAAEAVGVPSSLIHAHAEARLMMQHAARNATAEAIGVREKKRPVAVSAPRTPLPAPVSIPAMVTTLRRVHRSYSETARTLRPPMLDTANAVAASSSRPGASPLAGGTGIGSGGGGDRTPLNRLSRPCCNICFDEPADAVLLECGHAGLCCECAKIIVEGSFRSSGDDATTTAAVVGGSGLCPMCRGFVTQIVRLGPDVITSDGRTIAQVLPQAYWRCGATAAAGANGVSEQKDDE